MQVIYVPRQPNRIQQMSNNLIESFLKAKMLQNLRKEEIENNRAYQQQVLEEQRAYNESLYAKKQVEQGALQQHTPMYEATGIEGPPRTELEALEQFYGTEGEITEKPSPYRQVEYGGQKYDVMTPETKVSTYGGTDYLETYQGDRLMERTRIPAGEEWGDIQTAGENDKTGLPEGTSYVINKKTNKPVILAQPTKLKPSDYETRYRPSTGEQFKSLKSDPIEEGTVVGKKPAVNWEKETRSTIKDLYKGERNLPPEAIRETNKMALYLRDRDKNITPSEAGTRAHEAYQIKESGALEPPGDWNVEDNIAEAKVEINKLKDLGFDDARIEKILKNRKWRSANIKKALTDDAKAVAKKTLSDGRVVYRYSDGTTRDEQGRIIR